MPVKILSWTEKTKRNGGSYLEVIGMEGEDIREYVCNFEPALSMVKAANKGDELDLYGTPTKINDGKYFLNAPKGTKTPTKTTPPTGQQDKPIGKSRQTETPNDRNNSFACAYAKDVLVACINEKGYIDADMWPLFNKFFCIFKIAMDTGLPLLTEQYKKELIVDNVLNTFEGSQVVDKPGDEDDVPF